MRLTVLPAAVAAATIGAVSATPAMAASALTVPVETAIYTFTDTADGGFPQTGLVADSSGALYGTTTSGGAHSSGVVFKLTPPASGQTAWTQTTLYAFAGGADGATSLGNLLLDSTGALYGTTYAGGTAGDGVVFKLSPPTKRHPTWTERVLYTFSGGRDGSEPRSSLIEDGSGNLYGTTTSGGTGVVGTVFKLAPPVSGQTTWTESVLYNFTGNKDGGEPFGGLVLGADGSFFGTADGYGAHNLGTVYQLAPPKKAGDAYRFQLLHAFRGGGDGAAPRAGMIADSSGALYGTTAGFDNGDKGTVFKLTPPATAGKPWKEDVLYRFAGQGFDGNGPWQAVSQDASGALYGTTLGVGASSFGEVFKLTPPAAGKKRWAETVLYAFTGGASSQFPYSNVVIDSRGVLFGTAEGVAGQSGFYPGIVWQITQ